MREPYLGSRAGTSCARLHQVMWLAFSNLAYPIISSKGFDYDNVGGEIWRGSDIMSRSGKPGAARSINLFDIIEFLRLAMTPEFYEPIPNNSRGVFRDYRSSEHIEAMRCQGGVALST